MLKAERTKTMTVENMVSTRTGNPVANQFVITDGKTLTFQSYESEIMNVNVPNRVMIIHPDWNYSRTTAKYRNAFLEDYCNIRNLGVKEIRSILDFMSDLETDEQEFEINGEMWTVKRAA